MLNPEIKKNAQTIFSYLFGQITKYEYRKCIGEDAKALWSLVSDNGYVLVNCKLYLYARHVAKSKGLTVSPARFGIEKEDVRTLNAVSMDKVSTRYKAYSLFDFNNLEGSILTSREIRTYLGKFISKKLIFLTRSYEQKRDDIEGNLRISGLFALRKQYPFFKTELHALNICKTSMANAGHGMIEFWTRDKRNALLKENNTFQAVKVQYEVMTDVAVMPEHADETRVNIHALVAVCERLPEDQRSWVNTAAGMHDRGFSLFIGQDNRDAVEIFPYPKYLSLLCEYFRVPKEQVLSQLREALT